MPIPRGVVVARKSVGWLAALLGFEDEAIAFIEVDPTGGGGTVRVVEGRGAFEHVGVLGCLRRSGIGTRHADEVAELEQEGLKVGAFGGARVFPTANEIEPGKRCACFAQLVLNFAGAVRGVSARLTAIASIWVTKSCYSGNELFEASGS